MTMPPASPILAQRCNSLIALLHIVHVDHGDALEALGLRAAELGEPVVVSSENLRQQRSVRHAVQQQTDRGIDDTHVHPIGIHILEVLLRDVAAAPDFIKGRGADHLFRRLKPHTCLCPPASPITRWPSQYHQSPSYSRTSCGTRSLNAGLALLVHRSDGSNT